MEHIKIRSIDGIELDAVIHPRMGHTPLGCVIQVHGITADMDEGGMFVRLAERLADLMSFVSLTAAMVKVGVPKEVLQ